MKKEAAAQITKRYLQGRSMASFARGLGIPGGNSQMVYNWREGKQAPSYETLFAVLALPGTAEWARAWANEILRLYAADLIGAGSSAPTKQKS